MRTKVAIIGSGPAGILIGHIHGQAGIENTIHSEGALRAPSHSDRTAADTARRH